MNENLHVVNYEKYTEKIQDILGYTELKKLKKQGTPEKDIYEIIFDNIKAMAKKVGVTENTVKNWLKGSITNSSKCIQKLLKEYNLTFEDLGVEEIKLLEFAKRLDLLKEEKKWNNKKLATILGVSSSTISEWLKGNKIPSIKDMINYADKLNVHYLYLLGVIEERQPTYSVINKLIGIDEKTSIALLEYKTMTKYGEDLRAEIEKKCGFTYREIVQDVIKDTEFIDAIYFELYRILSYRLTDYKDSFDDFMNTIDLEFSAKELGANSDGSIPFPTNNRISQEEISNLIVTKCLDKMINDMVNKYYEIAKKKGFLKNENPLLYNMGPDIK